MLRKKKLDGMIIVTYRCNARCSMCNQHRHIPDKAGELSVETLRKLPRMGFCNVTGGEPFVRQDLKALVAELYKKADRIVIVTNGYFTERILDLCKTFPKIGLRISVEGLKETNDLIRGIPDGYERAIKTLTELARIGHPDVGFSTTLQDANVKDILPLYDIGERLGFEHATSALHNSFYFQKHDNAIQNPYEAAKCLEALINRMLASRSPKKWFRAYFNRGLIHYLYGQPRLLPCEMGRDAFFLEPYGDVVPCNGSGEKWVMGNLTQSDWDEIFYGARAEQARKCVKTCDRNCWMIGSVSPAMHKRIWIPLGWILWHKLFLGNRYRLTEEAFIGPCPR